jgi:hypothetical protein
VGRIALRVERDDDNGVDGKHKERSYVASGAQPYHVERAFDHSQVRKADGGLCKGQGIDTEDLRQQVVILRIDSLLCGQVVRMPA